MKGIWIGEAYGVAAIRTFCYKWHHATFLHE